MPTFHPVARPGTAWWLDPLVDAIRAGSSGHLLGKEPVRPVAHASGCSGLFSELFAAQVSLVTPPYQSLPMGLCVWLGIQWGLAGSRPPHSRFASPWLWAGVHRYYTSSSVCCQALQMRLRTVSGSDSKPAAQAFFFSHFAREVGHYFRTLSGQAHGGYCLQHQRECSVRGGKLDLLVTGTPCQAWTRLRDKSKTASSDHEGWNTTFEDFFALLDGTPVAGGIAEQVMGFADTDNLSSKAALKGHQAPYFLFVDELQRRGYRCATFRLNMDVWVTEPPRQRLYIVYVSEELGGLKGLDHIERVVQDWREDVSVPHRRPVVLDRSVMSIYSANIVIHYLVAPRGPSWSGHL